MGLVDLFSYNDTDGTDYTAFSAGTLKYAFYHIAGGGLTLGTGKAYGGKLVCRMIEPCSRKKRSSRNSEN